MYKSYVQPILEYGDIVFSNMTEEQLLFIGNVNQRAGRIVLRAIVGTIISIIHDKLGWALTWQYLQAIIKT